MIVYDLEIVNAILNKKELPRPGSKYCDGWGDHAGMGISVITAYDYDTDRYRVFLQDNLKEFEDLCSGRLVIGFNSIHFDDKVCSASGLNVTTVYDLRKEICAALNAGPFERGLRLDEIARANLRTIKSGHGADAPHDWQAGKHGAVIDYCLEDTRITKRIVDKILRYGSLIDPRNGQRFHIRRP